MIQGLKLRPLLFSKHVNESREVETCMIAHVFVLTRLWSVDVEFNDFAIDVLAALKSPDERPDVLEGSASDKFWSRVF